MTCAAQGCGGDGAATLKAIEKAFAETEKPSPPKKRSRDVVVGRADEVPVGERKIVQIDHLSIGIFHLAEGFHALRNYCPHQGAELCKGTLHGTHRPGAVAEFTPALEGRVLRCPWHGWEFDVVTGKGLYDEKSRVMVYEVKVTDAGELVVVV